MASMNKTKKSKKREREANKIMKLLKDKQITDLRNKTLSQHYVREVPSLTHVSLVQKKKKINQ